MSPASDPIRRTVVLPDLAATSSLADRIAGRARAGDFIGLSGDLGAGKTEFARAFIHARQRAARQPLEEVPSPTFTLVQVYELADVPIWHFDLYRVTRVAEVEELGLEEALSGGIALVEWPDRLGSLLPPERLDLLLHPRSEPDGRTAELHGYGEPGRRFLAEPLA